MKKCMALLALALMGAVHSLAAVIVDDLYYNLNSSAKTAEVTYLKNPMTGSTNGNAGYVSGNISIPETIEVSNTVYKVTSIGTDAFYGCVGLESVELPNTMITIGSYAFYGCTSLQEIVVPNSVTAIQNSAFENCTGLKSIIIGNGVEHIYYDVFKGCAGVEDIVLLDGDKSLTIDACICPNVHGVRTRYSMFHHCPATTVYVGRNLSEDSEPPFRDNASIKQLTIGNCVTSISALEFSGCTGITNVSIPASVKSISEKAFFGCKGLLHAEIGEFVVTIGSNSFYNCSSLQEIVIPKSVTEIGDNAFKGCKALESVTMYDNLLSIGNGAFEGCSKLKDVVIPNTVTNLGGYAFEYCSNLESVIIGQSVEMINESTFFYCSKLKSITIPNSVSSVQSDAFNRCESLERVTIGDGVKSIGERAFYYCKALTDVTFGNQLETIGKEAFSPSSVKEVRLPDSMISLGESAFGACPIENLYLGESIEEIGESCFGYCKELSSVNLPNSLTLLGTGAFSRCQKLSSVTIGNGLQVIPEGAFSECDSLTEVEIPGNIKTIGDQAFWGTGLETLILKDGIETIGAAAFNQTKIKRLVIPSSVTCIDDAAFDGLSEYLKEVVLCDGTDVLKIKDAPFNIHTNLDILIIGRPIEYEQTHDVPAGSPQQLGFQHITVNKVWITDYVEAVPDYICWYCNGIEGIYIGNGIMTVGQEAFGDAESQKICYVGRSVSEIGDYALLGGNLTDIYLQGEIPPTVGYQTLYNYNNVTLHYPIGSPYSSAPYWYNFSKCDNDMGPTLNFSALKAECGTTVQLGVVGYARNGLEAEGVKWYSSNPDAVSVSQSGLVTVIKSLKATVAAMLSDGTYATCVINGTEGEQLSGIEELDSDVSGLHYPATVYNMQGIPVQHVDSDSDLNSLTPGFYIVNGQKVMIR
ncbi:MAG: leucine-rich repeat protein [Pseudoflavonifractor sp.]|nr:leucine-rich repeat protein [Pseudoflavonifractor sp.]